MENKPTHQLTIGDLINQVLKYFSYLLKRWWQIALVAFAGAGIGVLLFVQQKPKYEAECSFILEERQSGLGGLGGIASQFGLDLGSMSGGGGMFTGDNIFEILTSKAILKQVLLSKTDPKGQAEKLADRYLLISGLKEKWRSNPRLDTISFTKSSHVTELDVLQDSVLNIVFANILKKHLSIERVSKKGTIIKAKLISIDPVFSKLLVERLIIGSRDYYIQVKTSVTSANVVRLQKKADSLLILLSSKTYNAAQLQSNDPNPALKLLQVPVEMATRDKTIMSTLYAEVIKNLEIARTTQMMQTPVLEILDTPSLSLYDNKKGLLFYFVLGGIVLAALYCVYLFFRFSHSAVNKALDEN